MPFPYNPASPTAANGENDFDNAQVSKLILKQRSAGVLNGSFAIASSFGYQRFCSNYLATSAEGFDRKILFTNEESPDYVYRQEDSWPPVMGSPRKRRPASSSRSRSRQGKQQPIYGMGRHNHENNVPIPGFGKPVVLSGDDTFTSGPLTGVFPAGAVPAQSQLYSYIAPSTDALLADEGDLWAFVSDTPGVKNYYDVLPSSGTVVTGHFIKVPKDIATGKNPDGSELKAADKGYPRRPRTAAGRPTCAPPPRSASTARSGCSSTGATSTTSSSSSASRTSPTTSGRAWGTSSTSSTRAVAGRPPRAWTRPTSSRRTAASGRWCWTPTIRRR